jgi:excisionase family DNA binding protein
VQTTRHLRGLPATTADRRLLTVVEAATELRVSRSTVYTLIRGGKLRTVKMGRATRIATEDLEACVQQMRST